MLDRLGCVVYKIRVRLMGVGGGGVGVLKARVSGCIMWGLESSSLRENMGKYAIKSLKASNHQSL